jgi:hypothetical protein
MATTVRTTKKTSMDVARKSSPIWRILIPFVSVAAEAS